MSVADENLFLSQPEFIEDDPRTERPEVFGYKIDAAFMLHRHQIFLPKSLVENRSVLDLGSCNAATGAWCLSQGAKFYTGVEMQDRFVETSVKNLSKYYPRDRWDIEHKSVEEFITQNKRSFDVIVASGVIHGLSDAIGVAREISKIADFVVFDSDHPRMITRSNYLSPRTKAEFTASPEYGHFIENEAFISLEMTGMSLADRRNVLFSGYIPSMGALKFIMIQSGFADVPAVNQALKKYLPEVYSPRGRFGLAFYRSARDRSVALGLRDSLRSPQNYKIAPWEK
jgi:hypothetical protein